ncbi:MAG: hypothetical protein HQ567_33560 [Candidatus Nealsonbacteria bacterium]|nr:hypothetical protein [Candidatus Nealsonbacteria bacterium]
MVISVEPGIYLPKAGGFRHSDTVLVTDSGSECLTECPTDIESLTITTRKPLARLKRVVLSRALGLKLQGVKRKQR